MNTRKIIIGILVIIAVGIIWFVWSRIEKTPDTIETRQNNTTNQVDTSSTDPLVDDKDTGTNLPPRNDTTATTTSLAPIEYTVSYTDSGYTPSSLTIRKGDSVKFVNNSTGKIWTASDPHPEHTTLPAFDQKSATDPGTSWTYAFNEAGDWTYHNHRKSAHKGLVVVQ